MPRLLKRIEIRLIEKLAAKAFSDDPDACWEWLGRVDGNGYGTLQVTVRVHQLVFDLAHGSLPVGHEVDHTCFNRLCWNPAHLEGVTSTENRRRMNRRRWGGVAGEGFCLRGHDLSVHGYRRPGRKSGGHCLLCQKERKKANPEGGRRASRKHYWKDVEKSRAKARQSAKRRQRNRTAYMRSWRAQKKESEPSAS